MDERTVDFRKLDHADTDGDRVAIIGAVVGLVGLVRLVRLVCLVGLGASLT